MELYRLYGKINTSQKRISVAEGIKLGKNFEMLACELNISIGTAEVYTIDCLVAGQAMDHEMVAKCLQISRKSFSKIKEAIISNEDRRLRTIQDNLNEEFSYNEIHFVLACIIQELDI